MPWLLDTNAWIHYLKHPGSPIRARLQSCSPADIFVCSIVKAELFHGARKYDKPERRVATVTQLLAPFLSLPFDDSAAARYADVRHELERSGQVIGPYDLMIAAIALEHDLTLVTTNAGEFRRVPGLRVEDWLTTPA